MKLQVVYDELGNIIATSEVVPDRGDFDSDIIPDSDQHVAVLDVPQRFHRASPIERHELLRVDVASKRLLERNDERDD